MSDVKIIDTAFSKIDDFKDDWEENERYYEALYSDEKKRDLDKTLRSNIFIPIAQTLTDIALSIFTTSFFSSECPIELQPVGYEDRGFVNHSNVLIKHFYKNSNGRDELGKAMLGALIWPMGIVISYWDETRKNVITSNVSIMDIAFDYEANNIRDLEYIAYRFSETTSSIKTKIKSEFYNKAKIKKLFGENEKEFKRHQIKEIYRRKSDGWEVNSYLKGVLLRRTMLEKLPFQFGYALRQLPKINDDDRKDQVLAYGASFIRKLMNLNDEMNIKRNQKNDLQEENLNPSVFTYNNAAVKSSDLKKGAGKRIKVTGKKGDIEYARTVSDYSLDADVQILNKDLEDVSGINGIQRGQTGASDRRSAAALATVSANSSPRTEEMIQLLVETLFNSWAKNYVRLVLKNVDDALVDKLIEGHNFPKKGSRNEEYNIKINFGSTLNRQAMMAELQSALQMLGSNPNINPKLLETIMKELLTYILGENAELEEIFKEEKEVENQEPVVDPREEGAL